jgi:sterol desaturase/sphingolipid hydroxylase (fatty acid hydroxylase superfamily)
MATTTVVTRAAPRRALTAGTLVVAITAVVATLLTAPLVVIGVLLAFVVFTPIERRWGRRHTGRLRPGTGTDLAHLFVNRFLIALAITALAAAPLAALAAINERRLVDGLPTIARAALWVVVAFVANYWGHRLSHEIPALWRLHRVHHSSTHLDWLATVRQHPLDAALTHVVTLVPLYALGFGESTLVGASAVFTVLAVSQHVDVPWSFGPLRWIVPSPAFHHWHHAVDTEAHDRNYGVPVVDLLFGTAYFPRDRRPSGFGVDDLDGDVGYLAALVSPLRGSRPTRQAGDTTNAPSFITPAMPSRNTPMSTLGSPSTTTRSASRPGATTPI